MRHQEGVFVGVRKVSLYYQGWMPEGEVRAVLLVVHGLAEHSGRYMNLVNRFVPLGYAVYGIDHIGHGRSEGRRLFVERFADYLEPLATYADMVRSWQPNKPVFLVGHSMGGLIGALHLIAHQDKLAGAVLSGPSIKAPGDVPKAVILIGRALSVLFPRLGLLRLEAEGVSRDPAVVEGVSGRPSGLPGEDDVAPGLGAARRDGAYQRRSKPDHPSAPDSPGKRRSSCRSFRGATAP